MDFAFVNVMVCIDENDEVGIFRQAWIASFCQDRGQVAKLLLPCPLAKVIHNIRLCIEGVVAAL